LNPRPLYLQPSPLPLSYSGKPATSPGARFVLSAAIFELERQQHTQMPKKHSPSRQDSNQRLLELRVSREPLNQLAEKKKAALSLEATKTPRSP
jgi:hypothetical protein